MRLFVDNFHFDRVGERDYYGHKSGELWITVWITLLYWG